MPTSPVSPVGKTNPLAGWEAPTTAVTDASKMDRDTFLKLLVAQVKNQNPAEPMNPNEMMSQMAQLTTVDKLTQLVEATNSANALNKLSLASSLVGRVVSWTDQTTGAENAGAVQFVRLDGEKLFLTIGGSEVDASTVTRVA